jgi:hypothetical protein
MIKDINYRIIPLLLIFLISHASAAELKVIPSSKTVAQGEIFYLYISIDPLGTAISGAQLNIEFNKSILNVNSITEGYLLKQNGAATFFNSGTINNSLGTVENIFNVILGPFSISTPEIFIIINVTAVGPSGQSGINLSNVKICDPYSNLINLNIINGSVIINKTAPDISPPDSVSNLKKISNARNYIDWTWKDPITSDFAKVMVYVNGKFMTNITNGIGYYRATDLIPNTRYTISTHTVDTSGNVNYAWVNSTAKTSRR